MAGLFDVVHSRAFTDSDKKDRVLAFSVRREKSRDVIIEKREASRAYPQCIRG